MTPESCRKCASVTTNVVKPESVQPVQASGSGRRFRNGSERLLTGMIRCAKCGSNMFGASGTKKGVLHMYYVCSKRSNYRERDRDYVMADILEAAVIQDIKTMFRDEQFMARIWAEANKLVRKEKPAPEKEIARIEGRTAKIRSTIDRYFEAFEAGNAEGGAVRREGPGPTGPDGGAGGQKAVAGGPAAAAGAAGDRQGDAFVPPRQLRRGDGRRAQPEKEAPPPPAREEGAYPQSQDPRDLVRVTEFSAVREP